MKIEIINGGNITLLRVGSSEAQALADKLHLMIEGSGGQESLIHDDGSTVTICSSEYIKNSLIRVIK